MLLTMFEKTSPITGPRTTRVTITTMATSTRSRAYSTSPYLFSLPAVMNIALKTFCPERTASVAPHTVKKTATRPEVESGAQAFSAGAV
jgi:hypothetical protein